MKEQYLGFEIARYFFIIRVIWKNVGMLDFVILDVDLVLNRYCLWS